MPEYTHKTLPPRQDLLVTAAWVSLLVVAVVTAYPFVAGFATAVIAHRVLRHLATHVVPRLVKKVESKVDTLQNEGK